MLEIVAEFILRPVLEGFLELFGYLTGRVVVPLFTLGIVRVEPVVEPRRTRRGRRQPMEARRSREISADAGAFCGILFWLLIGLLVYFLY